MSQINLNFIDDLQFVLLLSCFVGHPVIDIDPSILKIQRRQIMVLNPLTHNTYNNFW